LLAGRARALGAGERCTLEAPAVRGALRSAFFFQAEDGIRDRNVTGVQTCALPISRQCLRRWVTHIPQPARRLAHALRGGLRDRLPRSLVEHIANRRRRDLCLSGNICCFYSTRLWHVGSIAR